MKNGNKQILLRRILFIIYDLIAINLAIFLAIFIRFEMSLNYSFWLYYGIAIHYIVITMAVTILIFALFHMYTSLWAYAGVNEMINIFLACILSSGAQLAIVSFLPPIDDVLPRSFYPFYALILFVLESLSRFSYRGVRSYVRKRNAADSSTNVMIVGAGNAGEMLMREIGNSCYVDKRVVCVIDDTPGKIGSLIHGVRIVGNRYSIPDMAEKYHVNEIMIAIPSASEQQIKEILDICKDTGCSLKRLPGVYQLINGEVSVSKLKDVDVMDLLGREPVRVNLSSIMNYVSGKIILVTGGGGSIGSELCRQVASHKPKMLIIVDIYENSAYDIQNELKESYPELNLVVLIASVRNTNRINKIFEQYRPEIVYHAAAHKHVPLMEDSPNEAIKNNVLGTWKVAEAADRWGVRRFVMISTDKAVNPTNIMGASKRICEMLIQTYNNRSKTEFVAVRFGNVLGSNGSVIPLFKKQIEHGGPVTVTHPDIVRYFMTIPEAVSLVLQAGAYAKGGEIFVLDMGQPVRIADLARNLILLSGHKPDEDIKIVYTGLRPGEKLYEEMLMDEEGLQETENKLIHIGKPIEMDEEGFMKELEELKEYVVTEPEDIRIRVKRMVPGYHMEESHEESAKAETI